MTLLNLYTNQITISRLSVISGDKTKYSTITAENVCIQRMNEEKTINIGGAIGKTFRMYAEDNADIEVGDKLVDENGDEYKVKAVTKPAELGNFQHLEIIITLVK